MHAVRCWQQEQGLVSLLDTKPYKKHKYKAVKTLWSTLEAARTGSGVVDLQTHLHRLQVAVALLHLQVT